MDMPKRTRQWMKIASADAGQAACNLAVYWVWMSKLVQQNVVGDMYRAYVKSDFGKADLIGDRYPSALTTRL